MRNEGGSSMNSRVHELLLEFEERLRLAGIAETTLYYKMRTLRAFVKHFGEKTFRATKETLEGYLAECFSQDHSKARYNRRISDVKQFYAFLIDRELALVNPAGEIDRMEKPAERYGIFTEKEVKRILAAIPDTKRGRRDRAIIELFYSTGMRLGELIGLDIDDVDFRAGEITVRRGKGGTERIVPVGREALAVLERYLDDRLADTLGRERESLFLNLFGRRPGRHGLEDMFEKRKRAAGIVSKGSIHALRHSCASHLLAHGAPLELIQRILGHRHLDSTHRYTHIMKDDLKNEYTKAHPKA
jgi:site-specific recombinase XerD